MPLFKRFATVTVAELGATGIFVENLRVAFQVEKDARGAPNKAVVQIWNLAESTRNQIRATSDVMILNAGYERDEKKNRLTVQMDVVDVQTSIRRPEVVTAITAVDGVKALRDKKLALTFSGGKTVKSIIASLASQADLVLRDLGTVDDAQYQNGFAEAGPIGDLLDRLAGKINANWSFQNGELQFAPNDSPAAVYTSVVNAKSGLIGSPVKRNKAGDINAPNLVAGWIFTSLLNPTIEPNGRVELESKEADGIFRVNNVKHSGDTHEGQFVSTVEVEEWRTS